MSYNKRYKEIDLKTGKIVKEVTLTTEEADRLNSKNVVSKRGEVISSVTGCKYEELKAKPKPNKE